MQVQPYLHTKQSSVHEGEHGFRVAIVSSPDYNIQFLLCDGPVELVCALAALELYGEILLLHILQNLYQACEDIR